MLVRMLNARPVPCPLSPGSQYGDVRHRGGVRPDKKLIDVLVDATKLLLKLLKEARNEQRNAIPPAHSLRALIKAKGGS